MDAFADLDPALLRLVRAPVWRNVEKRFALILLASISTHLAIGVFIQTRPMPVISDPPLDAVVDRFVPNPVSLPPLRKIPTIPDLPKARTVNRPASPGPTVKPGGAREQVGLVRVLMSNGGALDELLNDNGISKVAQALEGASAQHTQVVSVGLEKAKGPKTGQLATIGSWGATEGAKDVVLAAKTDVEVKVKGGVREEPLEVKGTVDSAALQAFISARKGAVQSCYERALKTNRGLKGRLVMRATLLPTGRASEVEVDENTLGNDEVASCVSTMIKSWRFPVQPKEDVSIALPFILAPAN